MEFPDEMDFDQFAELLDNDAIFENVYWEFKKAAGRDGSGELPNAFFETYSAMANTDGGIVVLGVEERPRGHFLLNGIQNTDYVLKSLWDTLHNPTKVNVNILSDEMVETRILRGKNVILISVPRADRYTRPVYVGENPFTGTFRRNYDGDYRCDEPTVRRMIADQVLESRDNEILTGFTEKDLDRGTLSAYRNIFSTRNIGHLWNDKDDHEFLVHLGGFAVDRASGKSGITLAGLLMFGTWRAIMDAVPHYFVDYREVSDEDGGPRWTDRFVPDGNWSGNLYDFFRQALRNLYRDLKVPFQLQKGQRIEDSPVHEAIREALINTIIHADYAGTTPILIEKRPHMILFRNPGTMRIPIPLAIEGGKSDCRNKTLQKMFRMIGYGEHAGSGVPLIYGNWQGQMYTPPEITESFLPEVISLTLSMVSLLPDEVMKALTDSYGQVISSLSNEQKIALVIAYTEGEVTHSRIMGMSSVHRHDLTRDLRELVDMRLLMPYSETRGRFYRLYQQATPETAGTLSPFGTTQQDDQRGIRSEHLPVSSKHLEPGLIHNEPGLIHNEPGLIHNEHSHIHTGKSLLHNGDATLHKKIEVDSDDRQQKVFSLFKGKKRVSPLLIRRAILIICENDYVTVNEIAAFLHRSRATVCIHYIPLMVREGMLDLKYPEKPSHPHQAYRTKGKPGGSQL